MKVQRVYVEKKQGFDTEAQLLKSDLADFLGIQYPEIKEINNLRILNRYDVIGLTQAQFNEAVQKVLTEPQTDNFYFLEYPPSEKGDICFSAEYLPGQYNQRADFVKQCIEVQAGCDSADIKATDYKSADCKSAVRSAVVYILTPGDVPVSDSALNAVKKYLINPVDSKEADAAVPDNFDETENNPGDIPVLDGFIASNDEGLKEILGNYALAMNLDDLRSCCQWFSSIGRDPTLAEIKVLDTYWSDHCRHTTFNTILEKIEIGGGPLSPALTEALVMYKAARVEAYGDAQDKNHPMSLMDMAVIGAKVLNKRGLTDDVDVSKEINACSIKIDAEFLDASGNAAIEPWLLLFKNETHNHPTEIEPFGGAATCLGGGIRDPLSGRAYVHQAMRITGSGDPRTSLADTLPGKLPQIKICREAAAGYSSYGNQIGLPAGQVAEFYHSGFLAKRMELGALIAAAPAAWVCREEPVLGDLVLLVGGKTGRDGIGGATSSSKTQSSESVQGASAEVQKGNAVEERKIVRLFRNPAAAKLIKRCNDFGAGGVSVAVGELAAGIDIDLDKVPAKYAGLDGLELAISESQERMAVVISSDNADAFIKLAADENLDAVVIATITQGDDGNLDNAVLRMKWRGKTIIELSRSFLNTNGARRYAQALLPAGFEKADDAQQCSAKDLIVSLKNELMSLRFCSRRGLQERFDGSAGSASVLFPWGGALQGTPECGMAALLPSLDKESKTASLLTFGYDPDLMEKNPYKGAKANVREAVAKFVCLGGDYRRARLSLQEYFPRTVSPETWGLPAAALLGALEAQLALGIPAIGGKDSMSGNYDDPDNDMSITVPPSLLAFAAGCAPAASIRSGALCGKAGNVVLLLEQPETDKSDEWDVFKANMDAIASLGATGCIRSAYPVGAGGAAVSLALMAFGNNTGAEMTHNAAASSAKQGSVLIEIDGNEYAANPQIKEIIEKAGSAQIAAFTIDIPVFRIIEKTADTMQAAEIQLDDLRLAYETVLAKVYPHTAVAAQAPLSLASIPLYNNPSDKGYYTAGQSPAPAAYGGFPQQSCEVLNPSFPHSLGHARASTVATLAPFVNKNLSDNSAKISASYSSAAPLVVLPVFPGTNGEWDMERVFLKAGAKTRQVLFRNRSANEIIESKIELAQAIKQANILALPGGFSAEDMTFCNGIFIANVLQSPRIADALNDMLENRDGLVLGINSGFHALLKLGLLPYGKFMEAESSMPVVTINHIGRHISRMVRTLVMENVSPWLALDPPGTIHIIPASHGGGRLVIRNDEGKALFQNGQVPFCYADITGKPALAEPDNPNGSDFAIEGLCSPDGRILGKMCHSERRGEFVHINIPGNKQQNIFDAGVRYFTGKNETTKQ